MRNVALTAKYEKASGSKIYGDARALGKQAYTAIAGATVVQGKRHFDAEIQLNRVGQARLRRRRSSPRDY